MIAAEAIRDDDGEVQMASVESDLEHTLLAEKELWLDGPPHELFKQMRGSCPVHWTERMSEYPEEKGFWSVTTAEDIHAVSRDWRTYSSAHGVTAVSEVFPVELVQAMFIGMDPPKHDRLKALFQAGFTPKRIAAHEPDIRAIVRGVLDRCRVARRCDLVADVAQPAVSRVIGSFMGIPEEDDAAWARLMNSTLVGRRQGSQSRRHRRRPAERHPGDLRALRADDRGPPRAPDRRPHLACSSTPRSTARSSRNTRS